MRKSKLTEEQIIGFLKQSDAIRCLVGDGPEVVEEHERPDRLAQRQRQKVSHQEAATEVLQMRFKHVLDGQHPFRW